jgi:hypothetical protein
MQGIAKKDEASRRHSLRYRHGTDSPSHGPATKNEIGRVTAKLGRYFLAIFEKLRH